MSNRTDDFDSVGIALVNKLPTMEKIQEIIGNQTTNSTSAPALERTWRQPRSVNHKYCDSCGESGDLMCCDQCPASFHLECLDPPMSEEDVPSTCEFVCKRCTNLSKIRFQRIDDEVASTCSNTSGGSGPTANLPNARKRRGKKNTTFEPPVSQIKIETDEILVPSSESPITNAFQMLIAASKYTNPKEFELLKEHCINDKIPGAYKSDAERKQKGVIEMDNGIVPLPLKFCQNCKRTCRVAPLLQCDFCPLLFHLDCLDPPLAVMPPRTDRWMCPAHAEQIIDDHVATSSRLSERVRLWNEFARRDDPDTRPHNVKMRFLRRVTTQRHRRLMTNGRTHNRPKMQVRVPDGVKLLYQHPPLLEPRLGDCVTPSVNPPPLHPSSNASLSPTEEDKDTFLKAVLKFNTDALKNLTSNEKASSDAVLNSDHKSDVPTIVNGESREDVKGNGESRVNVKGNGESRENVKGNGGSSEDLHNSKLENDTSSRLCNYSNLKGADVTKLDQELVFALAQRQIELLTRPMSLKIAADQKSSQAKPAQPLTSPLSVPLQDGKMVMLSRRHLAPNQVPRAVLTPLGGGEAFPMISKSLTVGSDYNQDICLLEVGHCNYVSSRHAVIFYDKHSRLFELLNYSGHGTFVDSVLYSCDLVSKSPGSSSRHRSNRLVRSLASLVDTPVEVGRKASRRKDRAQRHPSGGQPTGAANACGQPDEHCDDITAPLPHSFANDNEHNCQCSASCVLGPEGRASGLEGSAVLHHGSVLKFGCLHLLFSVVDPNFAAEVTT